MEKLSKMIFLSFFAILSVHAQVQTIAVTPSAVTSNGFYVGGVLNVYSNSFASLKSLIGSASLQICSQGVTITETIESLPSLHSWPIVIAGPATIQILQSISYSPPGCFATFAVEPTPFPAGESGNGWRLCRKCPSDDADVH